MIRILVIVSVLLVTFAPAQTLSPDETREACSVPLNASFWQVRVPRGHAISSRMEDQRLALTPLVLLNFTEKDDMIPAVQLANIPTNKMGSSSL